MMKLYGPFGDDDSIGYRIAHDGNGWRWWWIEPGEDDDFGSMFSTEAEAFADAARDWDENGGIVSSRLAAVLKARATALRKVQR